MYLFNQIVKEGHFEIKVSTLFDLFSQIIENSAVSYRNCEPVKQIELQQLTFRHLTIN